MNRRHHLPELRQDRQIDRVVDRQLAIEQLRIADHLLHRELPTQAFAASLAAASGLSRIRTFSIAFENRSCDERRYFREMAACLGTEHYEMELSADRALVVLLDEAATGDRPVVGSFHLEHQAEQVRAPAAEALLVVDEGHRPAPYFRRKALIRTSYCWASRA